MIGSCRWLMGIPTIGSFRRRLQRRVPDNPGPAHSPTPPFRLSPIRLRCGRIPLRPTGRSSRRAAPGPSPGIRRSFRTLPGSFRRRHRPMIRPSYPRVGSSAALGESWPHPSTARESATACSAALSDCERQTPMRRHRSSALAAIPLHLRSLRRISAGARCPPIWLTRRRHQINRSLHPPHNCQASPRRAVLRSAPGTALQPFRLKLLQRKRRRRAPSCSIKHRRLGIPARPTGTPRSSIKPRGPWASPTCRHRNPARQSPLPSTPGKIPSSDNPYGPGAAFETAAWLLTLLSAGAAAPLGIAPGAGETALQGGRAALGAPALIGGNLSREASGRIVKALQAAVGAGSLTREQAAVLLQRANGVGEAGGAKLEGPLSRWLAKYDGTTYGLLMKLTRFRGHPTI
jgi:hypothetical protein